MIIDNKKITF